MVTSWIMQVFTYAAYMIIYYCDLTELINLLTCYLNWFWLNFYVELLLFTSPVCTVWCTDAHCSQYIVSESMDLHSALVELYIILCEMSIRIEGGKWPLFSQCGQVNHIRNDQKSLEKMFNDCSKGVARKLKDHVTKLPWNYALIGQIHACLSHGLWTKWEISVRCNPWKWMGMHGVFQLKQATNWDFWCSI